MHRLYNGFSKCEQSALYEEALKRLTELFFEENNMESKSEASLGFVRLKIRKYCEMTVDKYISKTSDGLKETKALIDIVLYIYIFQYKLLGLVGARLSGALMFFM